MGFYCSLCWKAWPFFLVPCYSGVSLVRTSLRRPLLTPLPIQNSHPVSFCHISLTRFITIWFLPPLVFWDRVSLPGLKLKILLPQPSKCWDYRHVPQQPELYFLVYKFHDSKDLILPWSPLSFLKTGFWLMKRIVESKGRFSKPLKSRFELATSGSCLLS
jgi:hypothetical protein